MTGVVEYVSSPAFYGTLARYVLDVVCGICGGIAAGALLMTARR